MSLVAALCISFSETAWISFVDRYAPAIFRWIQSRGLQEADAADVTQEVMLKILGSIRYFEYDPARGKFRSWLKTIASNAARDWQRSRGRYGKLLSELPLEEIHFDGIDQVIEEEYQKEVLALAEDVVRERADSNTWAVYQMIVKQGHRAAEVAESLNMPLGQVYIAKSRILGRLRKTVTELMAIDEKRG